MLTKLMFGIISIALMVECSTAQLLHENGRQISDPLAVNIFYKFPYDGVGPSGYSRGKVLYSELIQGADGNFYGTTANGGSGTCSNGFAVVGCGTIFKITPAGVESVIYSFTYDQNTNTAVNGLYPWAGLVQGKDGNLYGTASSGGNPKAFCNAYVLGCGTIFKITPSGKFTLMHQFMGAATGFNEGGIPLSRLIQAADGKFYGTTNQGGFVQGFYNQGTIFSITPSGVLTTLHFFDGVHVLDGRNPFAGLTQAKDGSFYGTTVNGGTYGVGTVFRFINSKGLTVLHSFVSSSNPPEYPDGALPTGVLLQGSDGTLYGTATLGGAQTSGPANGGTIFSISPHGVFSKVFDFNPNGAYNGWYPQGGLIQASDGNFYGTTADAGTGDCLSGYLCGSVYELTPNGVVTQVAVFQDAVDGRAPLSAPLQGTDGRLYVTNNSGPYTTHDGGGTVVQIDHALPKPAPVISRFSPTSGPAGQKVTIFGSHFVGTTKVQFNGTSASFTVTSTNTIVAVVPTGATTGPIKVTNAGGSVTSVGSFTVQP